MFAGGARRVQSDRRGVQEGVGVVSWEAGERVVGKVVDIKEVSAAVHDRQLAMHLALFIASRGASDRAAARSTVGQNHTE